MWTTANTKIIRRITRRYSMWVYYLYKVLWRTQRSSKRRREDFSLSHRSYRDSTTTNTKIIKRWHEDFSSSHREYSKPLFKTLSNEHYLPWMFIQKSSIILCFWWAAFHKIIERSPKYKGFLLERAGEVLFFLEILVKLGNFPFFRSYIDKIWADFGSCHGNVFERRVYVKNFCVAINTIIEKL